MPGTEIIAAGSGGQGELDSFPADPHDWSREDIRTAGQAVSGRWPIRAEKRQVIIDTLTTIATNPQACGIRESVAAARTLLRADELNMEEEARAVAGPALIELSPGEFRPDFSAMSDDELQRYIDG